MSGRDSQPTVPPSNLVSAARAVLGFMTYDKECICEKCNVLLALEAAVVADETTAFRLLPIEREELIRWHTMCAQVSAQTDDFAGARRHRERLAELAPPQVKTTQAQEKS